MPTEPDHIADMQMLQCHAEKQGSLYQKHTNLEVARAGEGQMIGEPLLHHTVT